MAVRTGVRVARGGNKLVELRLVVVLEYDRHVDGRVRIATPYVCISECACVSGVVIAGETIAGVIDREIDCADWAADCMPALPGTAGSGECPPQAESARVSTRADPSSVTNFASILHVAVVSKARGFAQMDAKPVRFLRRAAAVV